jgi:hypothetical protein
MSNTPRVDALLYGTQKPEDQDPCEIWALALKLERELAEAKDQRDMGRVNINIATIEADKAVKALREAMNRLQADAQRYRWLRDNRVIKLDYGTPNPRNLDEMIDAARRGEGT